VVGPDEYLTVSGEQYSTRIGKPYYSILGVEITASTLATRVFSFMYYFLLGGYGINLVGLGFVSVILLIIIVYLAISFLRKVSIREGNILFFVSGLVPYLLFVYLFLPPFSPRYFLILIPFLSLVFTQVVLRIRKNDIRYVFLIILILLLISHSVFLVHEIRTNPSPPVQLIEYVNKNYGYDTIILLSGFAEKYFNYYGTALQAISLYEIDCEDAEELLRNSSVLSVSEKEDCEDLGFELIIEFARDPRVHIKRSEISLYELVKS
jgi:hypothetical protein